ncbi:hypothetical protein HUU05_01245 [candidate division KSB1 bacterium]|nr:hypothetical protein [candidate division KSB1 bacterium]
MSHVSGHVDPPLPSHVKGHVDPPPPVDAQQEVFFPQAPLQIYPIDLGLAFGLTSAVFTAIAILLAKFSNGSITLFEQILPGFSLASLAGIVIGLFWSLAGGFVLGVLTGVFYNLRLRRYV